MLYVMKRAVLNFRKAMRLKSLSVLRSHVMSVLKDLYIDQDIP